MIESFGAGHLFLLIAFLYLALTAYRNIVFLILVLFPFLVVSVYRFITWLNTKTKGRLSISSAKSALTIGLIGIVFYALIVSNTYYETTESRDRFGAEITAIGHPTGAADYILQQNLSRKKCFSDYLTSSYLLWRLQPDFKTFIDLRDLDVFSPAFFLNIYMQPRIHMPFTPLIAFIDLTMRCFTDKSCPLYTNICTTIPSTRSPILMLLLRYIKKQIPFRERIFSVCHRLPRFLHLQNLSREF